MAAAIAPKATIAVYFAGGQTQNIIHALQEMIHPNAGQPAPTIMSISYGWGPDDPGADSFSDSEFTQISSLFEDAATNKITVFVSSGDSGARIEDPRQAQTSYPASDPWVTACGGTTIGNVSGSSFDEYVWNDTGAAGPRRHRRRRQRAVPGSSLSEAASRCRSASGQVRPVEAFPTSRATPARIAAICRSSTAAEHRPVGGTSAVAPLYAGLIARINANLGHAVGFLNPKLYQLPASTFHDILGAPGPANNSMGHVIGYPAGPGWDACTGLGSVRGQALQAGLTAAVHVAAHRTKTPVRHAETEVKAHPKGKKQPAHA